MASNIGIIILAAGSASRMGTPKQLLKIKNQTLLERVIGTAINSSIGEVCVVLGANSSLIEHHLAEVHDKIHIITNKNWQQGMSSSIQAGLRFFLKNKGRGMEGMLVLLADQPLISVSLLSSFYTTFLINKEAIITATYAGTLGVPTLYSAAFFEDILILKSHQGAKKVIYNNIDKVIKIDFPNGAVDLDTLEDYQRFLEKF